MWVKTGEGTWARDDGASVEQVGRWKFQAKTPDGQLVKTQRGQVRTWTALESATESYDKEHRETEDPSKTKTEQRMIREETSADKSTEEARESIKEHPRGTTRTKRMKVPPPPPSDVDPENAPQILDCGHMDWYNTEENEAARAAGRCCHGEVLKRAPHWQYRAMRLGGTVPKFMRRTPQRQDGSGYPGLCCMEDGTYIGGLTNDCRDRPNGQRCQVHDHS